MLAVCGAADRRRYGSGIASPSLAVGVLLHNLCWCVCVCVFMHVCIDACELSTNLQDHCKSLFLGLGHKDFSMILPQATKCLLRNPDELMAGELSSLISLLVACFTNCPDRGEAVAVMLASVPLDCSQYASEFLKNVTGLRMAGAGLEAEC